MSRDQPPRRTVLPPLPDFSTAPARAVPGAQTAVAEEAEAAPTAPAAEAPSPPETAAAPGDGDAPAGASPRTNGARGGRGAGAQTGGASGRRGAGAQASTKVPQVRRGRRRKGEEALAEKPDRRLPVYLWRHNIRWLRRLRIDMEDNGARPGEQNDSLIVRAAITALERTGLHGLLAECRGENEMVFAIEQKVQGLSDREILRMLDEQRGDDDE